jgi:hypothetical protein
LGKIAAGDFSETRRSSRRQKAWFLPPASSRSCARAGDFSKTRLGFRRQKAWFLPPASSRSCARAGDFFAGAAHQLV